MIIHRGTPQGIVARLILAVRETAREIYFQAGVFVQKCRLHKKSGYNRH
jgi:hypothetical protein